jgi:peroxiredoxin
MVLLESQNLPLGSDAIDFDLPGIDGENHTLAQLKGSKATVIIFMCNHCPYVQAQWPRMVELQMQFLNKGVNFIGINANDSSDYPEDGFDKMPEYAKEYGMNFPYLRDEDQVVAKRYGALCTPDIFVYDKALKLAYHGRIDDNWQEPSKVTSHDLMEALNALVRDQKPDSYQHPTMGCSIKWKQQ